MAEREGFRHAAPVVERARSNKIDCHLMSSFLWSLRHHAINLALYFSKVQADTRHYGRETPT